MKSPSVNQKGLKSVIQSGDAEMDDSSDDDVDDDDEAEDELLEEERRRDFLAW